MPMLAVSPSPETPISVSSRLAACTPVAMLGMRPCTALKPCEWPRKYAGVLLEQPMPDSLATRCGSSPASHAAWMMPPVIALCPQPGHSVVLLPS